MHVHLNAPESPQLLVEMVDAIMKLHASAIGRCLRLNFRHVIPAAKNVEVQGLTALALVLSQQPQELRIALSCQPPRSQVIVFSPPPTS